MSTAMDGGADRVHKALESLRSREAVYWRCTILWKRLVNNFSSLEKTLSQKSRSVDSKHQFLDAQTLQALETLDGRERSVADRENAAIARVSQLKHLALAEFDKPPLSEDAPPMKVLCSHCRRMDSTAVLRFLEENRKELVASKTDIAPAIGEAVDPVTLVLDAVEEFVSRKDGKAGLADQRWACGILLREVFPLDGPMPGVARSVSERAAAVAEEWKEKMENIDKRGIGLAEALIFLEFVVGYAICSRFEREYLKNLAVTFPLRAAMETKKFQTRKGMAKLVIALGLGEELEDMIHDLIKNEKELEAVYFAHDSGLTQKFPPIPLIKAFLKNLRKKKHALMKFDMYSINVWEEAINAELYLLRSIIKCSEDHMLDARYTLSGLQKRLAHVERVQAETERRIQQRAERKRNLTDKRQNNVVQGNILVGAGLAPPEASNAFWGDPTLHSRPVPPAGDDPPYSHPSQGVSSVHVSPYGGQGQDLMPPTDQHSCVPEDMGAGKCSRQYGRPPDYGGYDYETTTSFASTYPL